MIDRTRYNEFMAEEKRREQEIDARAMTVNRLIVRLQQLQAEGHGDKVCWCDGCDCSGRCGDAVVDGGIVELKRLEGE